MAFKTIPGIRISGGAGTTGTNKAFGGYAFSMDYTIGVREATKLVISFVSEDGTYAPPTCSVINPFKIQVGGEDGPLVIDDFFYAIRTEVSKSSGGRRLTVTFYDTSVILDRIWVGLHKRMGDKAQKQPDSLIILGSERHPCDFDGDRAFTIKDVKIAEYDNEEDPCRLRCPGENDEEALQKDPSLISNPVIEHCRVKNLYNLLPIEYNFAELLYFIKQKKIKINDPQGFNSVNRSGETNDKFTCSDLTKDFYYPQTAYTGTLREVLTRWCVDLSLLFYWEKSGLNFIDIHTRPKIQLPTIDCANDRTEIKTLEGTLSCGAITYYGREGSRFDNPCPDAKRHELTCLTLFDLFGNFYYPKLASDTEDAGNSTSGYTGSPETRGPLQKNAKSAGGSIALDYDGDPEYFDNCPQLPGNQSDFSKGVPIKLFERACVCSLYDARLRWQYILYSYYQIYNQTKALNLQTYRLDRFGGLKILKVCSTDQTTGGTQATGSNPATYAKILNNTNVISPADRAAFTGNKGYFVVCELDQKKLEDQYQTERNLAENFMGKHWLKTYYQAYYGSAPQVEPFGEYIAAGTKEVKDFEFAHFYHSNKSRVAALAQAFKKDPRDNDDKPQTQQQELYRNVLSMIYFSKNAKWTPDASSNNYFKVTLDKYVDLLPRLCTNLSAADKKSIISKDEITQAQGKDPDSRTTSDALDKDWDDYYNNSLVVMALYPGEEFSFDQTVVQHTEEDDSHYNLVSQYKTGNLGFRMFYGLTGKSCVKMTINGIPVFTPAGMGCQADYQANQTLGGSSAANAQGLITSGLSTSALTSTPGSLAAVQSRGADYVNNASGAYTSTAPNYAVMVTANYKPFAEIPKVEVVQMTEAKDGETLRVEYNYKPINNGDIGPLNAIKAEAGQRKQCTLDMDTIKKYHKLLNAAFTNSIMDAYESSKFTVPGINLPASTPVSIKNGLESISIRVDDSAAVETTYGFGNTLFQPLSIAVATQAMEQNINDMQVRDQTHNFFTNRQRVAGKPATKNSAPSDIPPSSSVTILQG